MKDDLAALIVNIAHELNDEEEIELPEELTTNTVLFGEGGLLDSMGLVSLVIAVEQAIDQLGNAFSGAAPGLEYRNVSVDRPDVGPTGVEVEVQVR